MTFKNEKDCTWTCKTVEVAPNWMGLVDHFKTNVDYREGWKGQMAARYYSELFQLVVLNVHIWDNLEKFGSNHIFLFVKFSLSLLTHPFSTSFSSVFLVRRRWLSSFSVEVDLLLLQPLGGIGGFQGAFDCHFSGEFGKVWRQMRPEIKIIKTGQFGSKDSYL